MMKHMQAYRAIQLEIFSDKSARKAQRTRPDTEHSHGTTGISLPAGISRWRSSVQRRIVWRSLSLQLVKRFAKASEMEQCRWPLALRQFLGIDDRFQVNSL